MSDCIFCKIVKGEIPAAKAYEDDNVMAFLDIAPVHPGHMLVIPKKHYENIHDLPDDILQEMALVTRDVATAVKKGVAADGISVGMSNGKAAGQVVPHAHIHIMPRRTGDGLKLWPQGRYGDGEMELTLEKIKEHVKRLKLSR